jgi:ABC-type multidrug transport system fused ATPase/permease subunit
MNWLHTQITIVEQDPRLFNMSIADNISYGIPASTRKNIERAAKKSHLHEFIKGLPQGYDTIIGEYGIVTGYYVN